MDYKKLKEEVGDIIPSNYCYLPMIGKTETFQILTIKKAINPKFNFKGQKNIVLPDGTKATQTIDLGFYVECSLANGKILSVTNYSAFRKVFEACDIQDNCTIEVSHPAKGEWAVKKL